MGGGIFEFCCITTNQQSQQIICCLLFLVQKMSLLAMAKEKLQVCGVIMLQHAHHCRMPNSLLEIIQKGRTQDIPNISSLSHTSKQGHGFCRPCRAYEKTRILWSMQEKKTKINFLSIRTCGTQCNLSQTCRIRIILACCCMDRCG